MLPGLKMNKENECEAERSPAPMPHGDFNLLATQMSSFFTQLLSQQNVSSAPAQNDNQENAQVGEEDGEPTPPFLTLNPEEPSAIEWKKLGNGANKYRYESAYSLATKLTKFQEKWLPEEDPHPEMVKEWNECMKIIRSELTNIRIAERSQFGWQTVKRMNMKPISDDPMLQKKMEAAERDIAKQRKGTKRPAREFSNQDHPFLKQPFRGKGGARAPHSFKSSTFAAPYPQFGNPFAFQQIQGPAIPRNVCKNCGQPGHWKANCLLPSGSTKAGGGQQSA